MKKTRVILAAMLFTIAMSTTVFGEEGQNPDTAQTVIMMTDDREVKMTQAEQMLDDLYANEADQEIRNMAVDASMMSILELQETSAYSFNQIMDPCI